jgi:uncharacterized membrane protein YdfJ with MMPL/SSD domain
MKRTHVVRAIAVIPAICAAAVKFYAVRELVAALLMFSVLFGIVVVVVLVFIAIDGLALKVMTLLKSDLAYAAARSAACIHRHRDVLMRSPRLAAHRPLKHRG